MPHCSLSVSGRDHVGRRPRPSLGPVCSAFFRQAMPQRVRSLAPAIATLQAIARGLSR
jgi:hypothetical protein